MNQAKEKLQALFATYAKNLPNKISDITKRWDQLSLNWDKSAFTEFHRIVHNLCGSAGTYGYVAIGKSARDLEVYLKQLLQEEELTSAHQTAINSFIEKLKESLKLSEPDKSLIIKAATLASDACVYILDEDKSLFNELAGSLSESGYQIQRLENHQELEELFKKEGPLALIVDLDYLPQSQADLLSKRNQLQERDLSLICVASTSDILIRLKAIRMGSVAFFKKPVDTALIIQKLNQLLGFEQNEPYRILVVDDSLSLAKYYALILKEAGMTTHYITNPLLLLETIEYFQPDLILMDLYMPSCTGLELAAILRQENQYTRIPIIFLSAEEDRFKQLSALNLGGDDFLVKPIVPQQLIKAIISRAKRANILSSFMTRDSLTGLLNHTNILQRLDLEIARAYRLNQPLAFIMLDIDHFKQINDSYGHPIGDIVIKKLSASLASFFRRTDIVGRYGGEEFALIMPNTTTNNALLICNQFRIKFSEFAFTNNDSQFTITLSGGVASYPSIDNLLGLVNAADKALYIAKSQGRNQIIQT